MEAWVAAVLFFTCLCFWCLFSLVRANNSSPSLPPGPSGLPLLGHLLMLGELPHRSLQLLANKYGPIMFLRLGVKPTIIVSSPEAAELFLKTHDVVFASRPMMQSVKYISYGQNKSIVFAPYGAYWRDVRKLCTVELFSKIDMFKSMRKEEVSVFVESIKKTAELGSTVDMSDRVQSVLEDMTYRMVFGTKTGISNLKSFIQQTAELGGAFDLADYIPYIGALDPQGLHRRMKVVHKVIDAFLEKIIDEHVHDSKQSREQHRDFIDVMLSLMESNFTREVHLDRNNIKGIILDVIAAAMDTSSTAIEWVITELIRHPRVMKLVQQELEVIVGIDRMVDETDLDKLDYLKMVIKESMRLHAVTPLLLPHGSMEDITVNGYLVPKNSRVLINIWAIGRDPKVWSNNAEDFYPERFIDSNIDIHGHSFQFLPFGSGRRKCPGINIGMTMVQLVVAQLVHCFDLNLPNGMLPTDLDMTEKFGFTLTRSKHLMTLPSYRLSI